MMTELQTRVKDARERDPNFTLDGLANLTSFTASSMRNWFNGLNTESPKLQAEVTAALNRYENGEASISRGSAGLPGLTLDEIREPRAEARMRKRGNLYPIPLTQDIFTFLEYCSELAVIGVMTLDFQAGKTTGLKAWIEEHAKDSEFFEFDSFTGSSRCAFVKELGRGLGVDMRAGTTSAADNFRRLVEHLRQHPRLLILDQCEHLSESVFQVIRQIWDRTSDEGVGIAIVGAPVLRERMLRSRSRALGAIAARVAVWARPAGISRKTMAGIVKAEGFKNVDEDAFVLWYRGVQYCIGRLMRSIALLKHNGESHITRDVITGMSSYLWGMDVERK